MHDRGFDNCQREHETQGRTMREIWPNITFYGDHASITHHHSQSSVAIEVQNHRRCDDQDDGQ